MPISIIRMGVSIICYKGPQAEISSCLSPCLDRPTVLSLCILGIFFFFLSAEFHSYAILIKKECIHLPAIKNNTENRLFKINFFEKNFQENHQVGYSLDSDFVGPDLGLNHLQRLSTDDKIYHYQAKSMGLLP